MIPAALFLAQVDRASFARDACLRLQKERQIVGMAVAVYRDGQRVYEGYFGHAEREAGVAVSPKTLFRLASVSKPITAVATMRLVEQGKLRLDTPVFQGATLRQLLSHTGGVRHYRPTNDPTNNVRTHFATQKAAMGLFEKDALVAAPGEKYSYSTHGYTVVGAELERVTGLTFPELLRRGVLRFGGVDVEDSNQKKPARSALYRERGRYETREDLSWKYAGGGMEASARGLAEWGSALLAGKIVSPASLKQLGTPIKNGYGLGFGVGRDTWSHNGGQQGARSAFFLRPSSRTVVVVLSNTDGGYAPDGLARYLLQLFG